MVILTKGHKPTQQCWLHTERKREGVHWIAYYHFHVAL